MTSLRDQLARQIVALGLLSAEELQGLFRAVPAEKRPQTAEALAQMLCENGKLTKFQASELLANRGTKLVLGDYVIHDRLGAGGMGLVFRAQHRHMGRLVAIKLLPESTTQDVAVVQRFQREVKAAAKLTHPNIVQAYDASVQRGVWYLVMECIDGSDLSARVKQHGPLALGTAIDFIIQAARACSLPMTAA